MRGKKVPWGVIEDRKSAIVEIMLLFGKTWNKCPLLSTQAAQREGVSKGSANQGNPQGVVKLSLGLRIIREKANKPLAKALRTPNLKDFDGTPKVQHRTEGTPLPLDKPLEVHVNQDGGWPPREPLNTNFPKEETPQNGLAMMGPKPIKAIIQKFPKKVKPEPLFPWLLQKQDHWPMLNQGQSTWHMQSHSQVGGTQWARVDPPPLSKGLQRVDGLKRKLEDIPLDSLGWWEVCLKYVIVCAQVNQSLTMRAARECKSIKRMKYPSKIRKICSLSSKIA